MGYADRNGDAVHPEVGAVFEMDNTSGKYLVTQYSEFFEMVGDDKEAQIVIQQLIERAKQLENENKLLQARINELEASQGLDITGFDDPEAKAAADAEKAKAKAEAKAAKSSKK